MIHWLARSTDAKEVVHRIGRDCDGTLIADWPGVAYLRARPDGTIVERYVHPRTTPKLSERLKKGPMEALHRSLRGLASFHGAAVSRAGNAVLLFGHGGQGKSTLAAAMCTFAECTLVADDVIHWDDTTVGGGEVDHSVDLPAANALHFVEGETTGHPPTASESSNARRLSPKRQEFAKAFYDAEATPRATPVAIVSLAFGDEIRLRALRGADALSTVLAQSARFALDSPSAQKCELERALLVVHKVPVLRFERPRSFPLLAQGARFLANTLLPLSNMHDV